MRVVFDEEQVVRRVELMVGRTSELNLDLLQLLVLVQVIGAEVSLLPPPPTVTTEIPPTITRLATPAMTERALRLAERLLEPREAPPEVARGSRADVLVTTTGVRVSGLEINPAWASRVNPIDLAARLSQRVREAQQACRRDASGGLESEVAAFGAEVTDIMEGR